METYLVEDKVS